MDGTGRFETDFFVDIHINIFTKYFISYQGLKQYFLLEDIPASVSLSGVIGGRCVLFSSDHRGDLPLTPPTDLSRSLFFAVGVAGFGEMLWEAVYMLLEVSLLTVCMTFVLTSDFFLFSPLTLLCRGQQSITFHILR